MAGTRSSARLTGSQKSSPTQAKESPKESPKPSAGSKRKLESSVSPSAKRGRKTVEKKEQKTIEDTMDIDKAQDGDDNSKENVDPQEPQSEPRDDASKKPEDTQETASVSKEEDTTNREPKSDQDVKDKPEEKSATNGYETTEKPEDKPETNGHKTEDKTEDKANGQQVQETSQMDNTGKIEPKSQDQSQGQEETSTTTDKDTAVEAHARDEETPSSVLEKGVIYFLFRGRVGIEDPSEVNDIARSYMILRPIPHGAKLGDGPIGDGSGKCRLLALPKKVLPLNGKDKFMTFVEKSKTTFKELREDFLSSSDYSTNTAGVRHTPAVTPVAEGVYAITTTGRESHLAYMISIPQELGEVQKDMGIREQGSFITSAKNPQYAGPANTNLPQGPDFPKEILDEFRSLRWAPLQPKFLDYENMQFLLIGDSSGIDGATEQQKGDKTDAKDELEKLEGEDEIRIKNLQGDDAVFADLGISKKEYSSVPSTWDN